MKEMLNLEQWPLMMDLQVEKKAGDRKEEESSAEASGGSCCLCSFFIKDLLQGQPACLPQGTPQFPRLCRERWGAGRRGEKWRRRGLDGPVRKAQKESV